MTDRVFKLFDKMQVKEEKRFNYRDFVDEYFYSESIFTIKDNVAIIYTKANLKGYFEEMKSSIFFELKRSGYSIKEVRVEIDKKNEIEKRKKNIKEENVEEIKYIFPEEKKKLMLDSVKDLNVPDEYKKYFEAMILNQIRVASSEYKECKRCKRLVAIDEVYENSCSVCMAEEYRIKIEKIKDEIYANPYLIKNEDVYIETRESIYREIINYVYQYINDNEQDLDKDSIKEDIKRAIIFLTGIRDEKIIEIKIDEEKRKIEENLKRNGKKINL